MKMIHRPVAKSLPDVLPQPASIAENGEIFYNIKAIRRGSMVVTPQAYLPRVSSRDVTLIRWTLELLVGHQAHSEITTMMNL